MLLLMVFFHSSHQFFFCRARIMVFFWERVGAEEGVPFWLFPSWSGVFCGTFVLLKTLNAWLHLSTLDFVSELSSLSALTNDKERVFYFCTPVPVRRNLRRFSVYSQRSKFRPRSGCSLFFCQKELISISPSMYIHISIHSRAKNYTLFLNLSSSIYLSIIWVVMSYRPTFRWYAGCKWW